MVDQAGLLDVETTTRLEQQLQAHEAATSNQLVVVTLKDLQGLAIEDYGYQLGRAWGIGQKGKDNGVLLMVAPSLRKVRIEVGYGLEGIMTDALSSVIIQKDILPQFRNDDMAGGIIAGVDRISTHLSLPEDEARLIAQDAEQQTSQGDGENIGLIIFWAFILIFFVIIPMFSNRGGKRYRRGAGPVVIWGGGSGWGGGSSGGGFGGGGFSGGGGSFGGGGASGGW